MDSPSSTDFKVHTNGQSNIPPAGSCPPSPTFTDAVTASEGVEDVAEEETSHVGRNGQGDIVSSYPDLGPALSTFLERIAPWKGIMPDRLVQDMEQLEHVAAAMQQARENPPKEPEQPQLSQWTCDVLTLTMEEWNTDEPFASKYPYPVIQVYKNSLKPNSESRKQQPSETPHLYEDGESLQRVQINSYHLGMELSEVTGIFLKQIPIFIAPPFKLLLEYVPQIEHRLSVLEGQLQDMRARPGTANNESTTGISAQLSNISRNAANTQDSGILDENQEELERHKSELVWLSERVEHLKCLVDFIRTEPDLQRLFSLRERIKTGDLETIRFKDLWMLFRPGDLVVAKDHGHYQLRKVYSTTGGQTQRCQRQSRVDYNDSAKLARTRNATVLEEDEKEKFMRESIYGIGSRTPLKVDCFALDFDGHHIRPLCSIWKIQDYQGDMRITDLDIYPVKFHPDADDLLKRMEQRGTRFLEGYGHKSYKGRSVSIGSTTTPPQDIDGDVYVDHSLIDGIFVMRFETIHSLLESSQAETSESAEMITSPRQHYRFLRGNEVDDQLHRVFISANRSRFDIITVEEAKASVEYLRLLPSTVTAYVFRLRRNYTLYTELLKDIDRRPEARDSSFNELVIPEKTRTLLISLVEDHASKAKARHEPHNVTDAESTPRPQIDLVRDKGQGLIILLHGPPGSGKTSTAETIAAYTQRPLYSLTCGDLGLSAGDVEDSLSEHTERAASWGCVLLLDEADVFLMQRNWHDMERNALVSVFLRQLEYYSGILFLTTNRPGVIDEAFLSRIHMAFRYPAIDLDSTKKMWNNIMDRIERDNKNSETKVAIKFNREKLLKFAERDFQRREGNGKPWNGRQIRNAFNTAIGLGRFQRLRMLSEKGISPEEAATSEDKQLKEIKLTKTNFNDISTVARSFEDYIQDLRGMDSDNARLSRVRDDHWGSDGPVAVKDYPRLGKSTLLKSKGRNRLSPTTLSSRVQSPEHSRNRPVHDAFGARAERHKPEEVHSDGSDETGSSDDG